MEATSKYLNEPLRSEAQAMQDMADASTAEHCDPSAALRNLLAAMTARDIAQEHVDRLRIVARLSLDHHYAAREAERRDTAEIAARMTT